MLSELLQSLWNALAGKCLRWHRWWVPSRVQISVNSGVAGPSSPADLQPSGAMTLTSSAGSTGASSSGLHGEFVLPDPVWAPPPLDNYGHRRIRCEACFRWRLQGHFPSSVIASVTWHEAHADAPVQRRTVYSCKECRAQEVAARERIEGFLSFRLPDGGAEE